MLNIRSYPPKCALIRELGWEPIQDFLNRQRFVYFSRFKDLPNTRLCKIVLSELFSTGDRDFEGPWNYPNVIRNIDLQYNLDLSENEPYIRPAFKSKIGSVSQRTLISRCLEKSSLQFYNNCSISKGQQSYLTDSCFKKARLKLLARLNVLPLNATLRRINVLESSSCIVCNNSEETTQHFLLTYKNFEPEPELKLNNLEEALLKCKARAVHYLFVDLPDEDMLLLLIGDTGRLIDDETFQIFGQIGKDILVNFWDQRHDFLTRTQ